MPMEFLMLYLFLMAWQVTRALGVAVLCLCLPLCFSFIKLKYAYFIHWIAFCWFSSALLSEVENWLDMQEVPFQAKKIKLGNHNCLKALCLVLKAQNKMQKNNLACKLISALTKCAELGAQKPAFRADKDLVQLFLLSPWAWNTDFAGRFIQLWGHGLLLLRFALRDYCWLILFTKETVNWQCFVFLLLNSKTGREKQVLLIRHAKIDHILKTVIQESVLNMPLWSGTKPTVSFLDW